MDLKIMFKSYLDIKRIAFSSVGNNILFSYNGWNYLFLFDPEAPNYFRLALPQIDVINTNFTIDKMQRALELSAVFKIAKAVIIENYLWLVFEQILPEYNNNNRLLFDMAITLLAKMANDWRFKDNKQ